MCQNNSLKVDCSKKWFNIMIAKPKVVRLKRYYIRFRNKLKSGLSEAKEGFHLALIEQFAGNMRSQ